MKSEHARVVVQRAIEADWTRENVASYLGCSVSTLDHWKANDGVKLTLALARYIRKLERKLDKQEAGR